MKEDLNPPDHHGPSSHRRAPHQTRGLFPIACVLPASGSHTRHCALVESTGWCEEHRDQGVIGVLRYTETGRVLRVPPLRSR